MVLELLDLFLLLVEVGSCLRSASSQRCNRQQMLWCTYSTLLLLLQEFIASLHPVV
jgi:hypothetical protein